MEKLDPYFISYNKIYVNGDYKSFYIEPKDLINRRRVDIVVKYNYIRSRETGENLDFAIELYIKHIEAFSDGTFSEQGNKDKDSIKKYIDTFNKLIDDFKKNGFDENISIIPIGKNNEILDGSHRIACAIYFDEKVKVMQFPNLSVDYGFEFFRKRLLDEIYIDFIVKEYVKLKKENYAMFIWPRVGSDENIKYIESSLKSDKIEIVYKKKLKPSQEELWNLIFNMYKGDNWVKNSDDDFILINEKRDLCYDENGYLVIYILEDIKVERLIDKKEELRRHFNVEKSSIHSTDTYEETIEILDMILDYDYGSVLYEQFLKIRKEHNTKVRHICRKIRYIYRITINMIKKIIGKPV